MNYKLVSSRSLAASFLFLACSGVARGQGATVYGAAAWGVNAYGQTDVPATASAPISDIAITLMNGFALKQGAVIEHRHLVAHPHDDVHVVLDEQDRHAPGPDPLHERREVGRLRGIHTGRRLVEEQ